jgi:hypothetical protein
MNRSRNACLILAFTLSAALGLAAQAAPPSAPLELIEDKAFVRVMVNGQGPFRFVVDTGTGGEAVITPGLAARLHLPLAGHAHLLAPGGVESSRGQPGRHAHAQLRHHLRPEEALVRFDSTRTTFKPSSTLIASQPLFSAGEWQTPGLTIRYAQPD